ncbi:MAG: T9SS C-terminal target domain-containing protein [Ignavibacteriales bacterium]|nr:MAG: T9SS C-terminal target domain-containing protein [Ignavibacteriales bacterium]
MVKFDGTCWAIFNTDNSGLPDNYIYSIAIDKDNNKWIGTSEGLSVFNEGGIVSVKEKYTHSLPNEFFLSQNYPNPFNPSTTIRYSIPELSNVSIKVYDVLGREVATLVDEEKPAGNYQVQFNAENLKSGIYFYTLKAREFSQTKKLTLLK